MTDYYFYPYKNLTGGGDGALDSLDGSLLKESDAAYVVVSSTGKSYTYYLDEDSAAAESSPYVIAPDSGAGDKRWVLASDVSKFVQTGNNASSRLLVDKVKEVLSVSDFGAVGDGTTDDAAAINAALDFIRATEGAGGRQQVLQFGPNGYYRVNSSIDMTGLTSEKLVIEGGRSTIFGYVDGNPVIDMLDSQRITIKDLVIYGDSTTVPSDGIILGRGINVDRPENYFKNIFIYGNFTGACVYNVGGEIINWDHCHFQNAELNGFCFWADSLNSRHITSQFFSVTTPEDTYKSLIGNTFYMCTFEQIYIAGGAGGPAINITGTTQSWRFMNCYAQAQHSPALKVSGDQRSLWFDCHCETTDLTNNVLLDVDAAAMVIDDFKLCEVYAFATDSVIDVSSNNFNATILNGRIAVQQSLNNNCVIFGNNGTLKYYGDLSVANAAAFNNLSGANTFHGELKTNLDLNTITWPTAHAVQAYSTVNGMQFLPGNNWTPVVTAATGTLNNVSATGYYRRIGSTVQFKAEINIVDNGNGEVALYMTLPSGGMNNTVCYGRSSTTGKMLQGVITGNQVSIIDYANVYAGANNTSLLMSGIYEVV